MAFSTNPICIFSLESEVDGQIPPILELRAKQHLLDLRVRRKYEKSYMVLYTTEKSALLSLLHTHIHSLNSGFPTIHGNFMFWTSQKKGNYCIQGGQVEILSQREYKKGLPLRFSTFFRSCVEELRLR